MNYLIVVDMQNDFIDGALGTAEAQAILPNVLEKVKSFTGTVLYTRDTHEENYLETAEGKKLPVPHCIRGTNGWEIASVLEDYRMEEAIDKVTFGSKELPQKLMEMGAPTSITLVGLCTDICVISNAIVLKAHFPEVPIIVDAACCAGVTPASHENALNAMKMCQIDVI